jgi:hypothetical protein
MVGTKWYHREEIRKTAKKGRGEGKNSSAQYVQVWDMRQREGIAGDTKVQ